MVQNKRTIKRPRPSEVEAYNPDMERYRQQRTRSGKRKSRYRMKKSTKAKIKALVLAGILAAGAFHAARTVSATSLPRIFNSEKEITIGVTSAGTEITVDGEKHLIDPNSMVLLSDNEALAFDENCIIRKGDIPSSNFTSLLTIPEEEMSEFSIYQVTPTDGVNVRSSGTTEENNIISTVAYQDYVLGRPANTPEYDGEWLSTISVNGENAYQGYIREDLLQEIGDFELIYDNVDETLMRVDTSQDGNVNLNLRTNPGNGYIMTTIPDGSIVRSLGEETNTANRNWSRIEYDAENDVAIQGWVASDFLQPYFNQEIDNATSEISQHSEELTYHAPEIQHISTNSTGNVTGIDISSISPSALRELLQTGIPENVSSVFGNYNTSQLSGDVNFVYIKLGASPYGNGDFGPLDYYTYIDQVKVCEELGIPYGFYYYSTSTNVEEANIELQHIHDKIEDLSSTVDMKYNLLEMVVDIELAGTEDRQYQGDIQEQTEAKAALINGIQELGISDNVLIYGPMRVMRPDLDQIFSLSDLRGMLSNPEDVNLWLCLLANEIGQLPDAYESYVSYIEEQGFDVVMVQSILDAKVVGRIDINNMDLEHFQKLVNYRQPNIQPTEYEADAR